ncbi:hypothetical protein [Gorillibacterium sp. CAU 1737]|uniref:hypothetical protein n=1 Tax=Gorillibacterium sp. CAU 1737 TaxID=3140362 RepID=UPI00326126D7
MNKKLKLLVVFSLLVLFLVQPVSAASKTVKIKVTLDRVELVENNHVGNEWYTTAYVNGEEIGEGDTVTVTLKPTESVKLEAYAEEQDKIPDVGTSSASLKASSITKKKEKALTVKVVENRGRYSGNSAKWKFTFTIKK